MNELHEIEVKKFHGNLIFPGELVGDATRVANHLNPIFGSVAEETLKGNYTSMTNTQTTQLR